ncbi:DSBA oxidoreductase [Sulfurimonas denitrificans DSM 1251]|uniref:DSBA oxidoreductase n=1 Tax=Sulfurimonas denitrificans (strain ATCC 33889 / DSM 1251) TaxID=326298 RepID=Q30P44_SULDN|nr:DsbA family protein [Sulfurimonas denitrificans]ABB45237.1 DSBA oxidoreductase [Sulfurimonas denitrificans DSM 1251]MDD3442031.1 DsbA family protein [Sulfurimonas denitrificans]
MTHTLYYVYDPMCSWCYAFRDTFKKVKKGLPSNVEVVYVAGGLAPHSDEPMEQGFRDKIQAIWYQIEKVVGTKFNHDFWIKCTPKLSTYLACQATLAAKNQGKEEEMIEAIQTAYYLRAMNPSDEDMLLNVAKELELNIEKFKNDLYSDVTVKNFSEKMNLKIALNVRGFPSLVLQHGKNISPIAIKFNEPEAILDQIKNLTTDVNF